MKNRYQFGANRQQCYTANFSLSFFLHRFFLTLRSPRFILNSLNLYILGQIISVYSSLLLITFILTNLIPQIYSEFHLSFSKFDELQDDSSLGIFVRDAI